MADINKGIDEAQMDDLLKKYKSKLKNEFHDEEPAANEPAAISSRQYTQFKIDNLPKDLSIFEKACNFTERIFRINPDKKTEAEMAESINICHLNITPAGILSASIFYPLLLAVIGSLISFLIFGSMFFVLFFFLISMVLMVVIQKLPELMANNWRMKASNQMVLCIFYVVTYMRHTSNLELAVNFAAEHLAPPLSIDLKKVLWNVESGKYPSIKESLDIYFETWRKWNLEFVESFHLIESSLYETSEDRRINLLDRSLSLILEETYEKMLHYAHNLTSPITMLHMLGVILPILGLVILPLVVTFMPEVKWFHIALLYDIGIPFVVFYLGKNMLSQRPTGYGDVDITAQNPKLKYYENVIIKTGNSQIVISPFLVSVFIFTFFFIIGISPIVMHILVPDFDFKISQLPFIGYRVSINKGALPGTIIGPYGVGATVLSLFIPLGLGLAIGAYFFLKSKNLVKIREDTKKLEGEFASAIFQLGNRVGDGLPVEIAFGKVADLMKGTVSGSFFELVSINIRKLGLGINQAIFDRKVGAITKFPSNMIESSMKVLVESAKKGPLIVSQALMNVSQYIKEIHRVDERLKDLLSDIISSMKSQISFLSPAIAGIVIGITSMITTIMGELGTSMKNIAEGGGEIASPIPPDLFSDGIPPYHFQIIVGIYLIEVTYILIVLANGIENGADSLGEKYAIGTELPKSIVLYCVISAAVIVLFNVVASKVMELAIGG